MFKLIFLIPLKKKELDMAVPDFQSMMNPVLDIYTQNGSELRPRDIENEVAERFNLTEEERNEMIPSNIETVLRNRVSWAVYYLFRAGLLERLKRGYYRITDIGKNENQSNKTINVEYLKKFPSFVDFSQINNKKDIQNDNSNISEESQTPDEMMSKAQELYKDNLQSELLDKLKQIDPVRFEQIVLQLMEKMNYGVGSMTKMSHDGGVDGIIDEDELGLEKIYLQAKRYSDNKVNEKEMQNFAGALGCSPVRKGVFITTSFFDERAKKKAASVQGKIIRLVDGEELTKLMIKHNLGVQVKTKIEIKKIDEDFFSEE